MINHTEQYNRVEETFKELQKEYEIFRKHPTYNNKTIIDNKIKEHREAIYKFRSSIKNIFFK